MKKVIVLALLVCVGILSRAQDSTRIFQNFDLCDSNTDLEHFPPGWSAYNVNGDQTWQCYSQYGVSNSRCLEINGYQAGANWANEDWLLTPRMNLSGYSGSIYLNFFSIWKYSGDSLHVMVSNNYTLGANPSTTGTWTELAHTGASFAGDTGVYYQFQVNLTAYKATPCFVGFKYTSTTSDGSRINIDSVYTTTTSITGGGGSHAAVANVNAENINLSVVANNSANELTVSFDVMAGNYSIELYDMVGRKIRKETFNAKEGAQLYSIQNCALIPGMYIVKLSNESSVGVAKVIAH